MTTYKADYEAIGEHILRADWMRAEMVARAEKVKAYAEATAPVGEPDEPDDHAGHYRDSFEVSSGVQHRATSRVYGRVTNTARYAAALEFGHTVGEGANARYVEGRHILTKALDAAGG